MKIIKIIAISALVVLVGIQFVPTERNQSDSIPKTDFMLINNVPNNIKNMLQVSCYDCHSNNTQYPWYNNIQPIAWFLENHVNEGKKELNFSEWEAYSSRRKRSKLKSIVNQIRGNKMPLSSYTIIHRDAKLSENDKLLIIRYIDSIRKM